MSDSEPQHIRALKRANEVRLGAAKAKRAIRAGEISPSEILDVPELQGCTVLEVLTSQHRWGKRRVARALSRVKLYRSSGQVEGTKLKDLTDRERTALTEAVIKAARKSKSPPDEGN